MLGMLSAAGAWTVLDSAPLPAGSGLQLAGIADYLHMKPFGDFEYGAVLYTGGAALPGALFTSTARKAGPADVAPLNTLVAAISVEY